jgi:hypothetical protein
MKQPHAWISIVLILGCATTAFAQSKSAQSKEPIQDAGEQRAAGTAQPGDEVVSDDESSDRTWRHLYGIQVDGVRLSALDKVQVTHLQQALQEQGYYTAKVDGVMGPRTRQALRQYYLDQAELASQDLIMPQAAASLGLDEADVERVRGEEGEHERKEAAIERTRGETPAETPAEKSVPKQQGR